MKISIASYSFHGLLAEGKIDAFGYLESCKYRYGLDTADYWNGLIGTDDEAYIRKIRQQADAREIRVVNYHVDGVHLWEDSADLRSQNRQKALHHLKLASILGAQTIRFDTGGKIGNATAEQMDYLSKTYLEYAKIADGFGSAVGPENHWGLSLYASNMTALANAVNHPGYGILLHLGHWEDCSAEVGDRVMAPWAIHTHVDANVTRNHLAARMQILIDAGYKGYWGVEHHSTTNEYAEVEYQIAEVKRVLARNMIAAQALVDAQAAVKKPGNPLLSMEQERG